MNKDFSVQRRELSDEEKKMISAIFRYFEAAAPEKTKRNSKETSIINAVSKYFNRESAG